MQWDWYILFVGFCRRMISVMRLVCIREWSERQLMQILLKWKSIGLGDNSYRHLYEKMISLSYYFTGKAVHGSTIIDYRFVRDQFKNRFVN